LALNGTLHLIEAAKGEGEGEVRGER